jgi:hypothetical protein
VKEFTVVRALSDRLRFCVFRREYFVKLVKISYF